MKCSNCKNNLYTKINCIFCRTIFCSYDCMESHLFLAHKKNLMINLPTNNNNNVNNQKRNISNSSLNNIDIQSPYLIPGILNLKRKYDEKYNLENFIPIFEDEKPKIIGGGSFGKVFLVMNTINKNLYAIKHMNKNILSNKLNSLEGIYKEIYIQSRIDHPNILPILYVNETTTDFDLVLEYASEGSLFNYIRNNEYLDEELAFSLFIQVINAVYFLHKNNLIHRDIKPENILLFENNIIKLCDFGWCVKLEEGQQRGTFCGTTEYMSPELVNHEGYSKEIDIWSLGVLLYEMVHGYSPFRPDKPNFNARDVIRNIRLHKLKFNENVSEKCKELIYHLLDENPNKRYKIEDVFYSDFVKYYENKQFGFPDRYLVEKYKNKLAKAQMGHSTNNSKNENYNKGKIYHHCKSFSNNIIISKNNEKIENNLNDDNDNDNDNNNGNDNSLDKQKNLKFVYCKNKKIITTSLSGLDLKCNKSYDRKLKKNKTSQYFHPLNEAENKQNFCNLPSRSKNNSQRKILTQYNINNENKDNNNENIFEKSNQKISKNETKIKTIIINNYFSNINNNDNINNYIETKNNNEEQKINCPKILKILPYKKTFHIKPLKMSKIPINSKVYNNAHSPTNKLNTILNTNYLLIKKHLSPTNKLNTEMNKVNSSQKKKKGDGDPKTIEIKKNNCSISPKNCNDIHSQILNKNNYNKKAITRNNLNNNNNNEITQSNYNSQDYLTKSNTNNSLSNCPISSRHNDLIDKKTKEKKLYCAKSLNQLKIRFDENKIKSMLISNIKNDINNLNNNSINNNEIKCISNKNTIQFKGNNLNLNDKKNNNLNIFRTKQNSPLSTFNNHFINKNNSNENKKIIHTNNSYNFNEIKNDNISYNSKDIKTFSIKEEEENNLNNLKFPLIKVNKNYVNSDRNKFEDLKFNMNLDKIINNTDNDNDIDNNNNKDDIKNKNYFYEKTSKLLNSMSYNSIFHKNKKQKIEKNRKNINVQNRTEINKKIQSIPKIKTFKKSEKLNIDININNKSKNENIEANRCNSNNHINNKRELLSLETDKINNKNNLNANRDRDNNIKNKNKNKNRNNSIRDINIDDIKYKIIKRLELNEFLNNMKINKEKNNINLLTNDNIINNSGSQIDIKSLDRINTSINNKNYYNNYFENNKQNYEENKNIKYNNKYNLSSRNYKNENQKKLENLKCLNNNDIKGNNNNNCKCINLNYKGKIINKKEPKNIPLLYKNKKLLDMINNIKKNINDLNIGNKYINKLNYNQIDYKSDINEFSMDK